MRRLVVDASVVLKWLLPEREGEPDVEGALKLLDQFAGGDVAFSQPPHWLAEVAAVITRLSPETADRQIAALWDMEVEIVSTRSLYERASALSREVDHHLFDTLYHALALALPDALLVTADDHYYRKAHGRGKIVLLSMFQNERES